MSQLYMLLTLTAVDTCHCRLKQHTSLDISCVNDITRLGTHASKRIYQGGVCVCLLQSIITTSCYTEQILHTPAH